MREIDLQKFDVRTDLIKDIIKETKIEGLIEKKYHFEDIKVSNIKINKKAGEILNKDEGSYTTISFDDITDKTNFKKVELVLIKELKKLLTNLKITKNDTCLIIGLGNRESTPDALGPKVLDKVLVTNHIYQTVGSLEDGYRITYLLEPGVMGVTGIETKDIIMGVIEKIKPSFCIIIDALASDAISRLNKTIQITDTGISPGSGIGNMQHRLKYDNLKIPIMAIGVPTVVDAITIVNDTINLMYKHFSFNILNNDDIKTKLVPPQMRNYLKNNEYTLDQSERKNFLGLLGTLNDNERKKFLQEVLLPVNYNLMVTPKEVDFIIDKLSLLIGNAINKSLHSFL